MVLGHGLPNRNGVIDSMPEACHMRAMCLAMPRGHADSERELHTTKALHQRENDEDGIALALSALAPVGV